MSKHGLGGAPGVGVLIGVRVPVRGWRALAQHAPKYAVREAALALVVRGLDLARLATVNSLIIENSSPIENGDFERFLAFRLARIGIFL